MFKQNLVNWLYVEFLKCSVILCSICSWWIDFLVKSHCSKVGVQIVIVEVSWKAEDARRNAKSKTNISTICSVGKFLAVRLSFFLWHPVALRVGASLLAHFDDVRVSVVLWLTNSIDSEYGWMPLVNKAAALTLYMVQSLTAGLGPRLRGLHLVAGDNWSNSSMQRYLGHSTTLAAHFWRSLCTGRGREDGSLLRNHWSCG